MGNIKKDVQIVIGSNIQGALRGLDRVSKSTFRLGRDMERMGTRLTNVFGPALKVLVSGLTVATAAAAGLAVSALNVGGSFEQQMALVKNVSRATADEFDKLTAKARQMGRDLPITAAEAASAMYELASAGMSVAEILDSIDSIVAVSIGQNYGLAESAQLVVSTLRGFGLEAAEAGRVVDVFTNAVNSSQLTMEKLSNSMTYVAPLGKALGLSLEEVTSAMAVLSDTGMEASQIGTSLRRVLSSIADPAGQAAREIENMGVKVYDALGNMRPLADIMADFGAAGMDAQQALRIFGDRGAVAAIQLSAMSQKMREYQEALKETGTAQSQLADLMGTWQNIRKAVTSAAQDVLLTVFEQIKEKSKEVAGALRDLINAINEWASGTEVIGESVKAFFEGLTGGLPSLEDFKAALTKIDVDSVVEKFRNLGETIKGLIASVKNIVTAIPWQKIFDNFEKVAKFVLYGWIAGKGLQIGGGILLLTAAFGKLTSSIGATSKALTGASIVTSMGKIGAASKLLTATLMAPGGLVAAFALIGGAYGYYAAKQNDYLLEVQENNRKLAKTIAETDEEIEKILSESTKEKEVKAPPKLTDLEQLIKDARETGEAIKRVWGKTGLDVTLVVKRFGEQIENILKTEGEKGVEVLKSAFGQLPDDLADIFDEAVDVVQSRMNRMTDVDPVTAIMGDLPDALAEFIVKIEQFRLDAQRAMKVFGVSSEDASEVFKSAVLKSAEETADGLVKKFDNPQLRNVFIRALESMGRKGGQGLLTQVANAMKQIEEQVLTLEDRVNAMLADVQMDMPQGEWQAEIISEDQDKAVVQLTDNVRYLFKTIEGSSKKAEGAMDWASALDFQGLAQNAELSLDKLGGYSQALGGRMGDSLYYGILNGIDKAVSDAKKKLENISVNIKVNASQNFNSGGLVTDAMRGDI